MSRAVIYPTLLLLAACGGGGGGTPASAPARLTTTAVDFAPASTNADLVVSLVESANPAPVLLQVAIELPPALTIAGGDPLLPLQSVPTLRGAATGSRYVVVCGDDRNREGQPLQNGELFRVRLQTTTPRQIGTHSILLRELKLARSDGSEAAADQNPVAVTALVR